MFLGIDVGTGSARAGLFSGRGKMLGRASHDIGLWRPREGYAQQASADIWNAVARSVRAVVQDSGCDPNSISGIGFDATCSLVVAGPDGQALSVDPDGAEEQDVIVWMDHRAQEQAERINRIGGAPLDYVGGRISPEMQLPKLLWLKENLPDVYRGAARFWDLPDWLVHRATETDARSLCTTVCKWTYLGHRGQDGQGWDADFFGSIGLGEQCDEGFARIGRTILAPGTPADALSERAAQELGLPEGVPVSASMIDAHAGALGTLATSGATRGRLAVIAGTSNCHLALSSDPIFVPGVWGPYFGAVLPELWVNEGGQSAAGALIDAVLKRHSALAQVKAAADVADISIHDAIIGHLKAKGGDLALLTARRHILPDFLGNRSPLAEPWRLGGILGLSLETGIDDLALDYLAAIQAIAYGTRHIIEAMRESGQEIEEIVISGGLAENEIFVGELADVCGCPVIIPEAPEPVLLGGAMLGAVAGGVYPDVTAAMVAMSCPGSIREPRSGETLEFHDRKYAVYRRMQDDYAAIERMMGRLE